MSESISRRLLLSRGAALFGAVALAACSTPASSPTPAKPAGDTSTQPSKPAAGATAAPKRTQIVKLKYMTPLRLIFSWLPDYVAVKGGFYEQEMLDVEIIGGTGSQAVYQQMTTKQVDFGRGSGITTILGAQEDLPLMGAGLIHKQIQLNVAVLPDGPIKEPKDLAGKTIGVSSRGGSSEWLAVLTATSQGVKKEDVRIEVTGPGLGGYGLMEQGRTDAFVVTDSAEVELIAQGKPLKVFRGNDYFKMPGDDYLFTNEMIQKNPDLVVSILRAIHRGRLFTMNQENWDQVIEYVAAYSPDEVQDKELAKKKIAKQISLWTDDGKWTSKMGLYDPADWTEGAKALREAGYLEKPVDVSKLYTNTFMEQVLASI